MIKHPTSTDSLVNSTKSKRMGIFLWKGKNASLAIALYALVFQALDYWLCSKLNPSPVWGIPLLGRVLPNDSWGLDFLGSQHGMYGHFLCGIWINYSMIQDAMFAGKHMSNWLTSQNWSLIKPGQILKLKPRDLWEVVVQILVKKNR